MAGDGCWRRFRSTGRVEDCLKFGAKKEDMENKESKEKEGSHAGSGEGHRSGLK